MNAKLCRHREFIPLRQPLGTVLRRFPGIRRHMKQRHDVFPVKKTELEFQGDFRQGLKAGVVYLAQFVFIRAIVEDLLQLPQMSGTGNHIQEQAVRFQDPSELLFRHG